MRWIYGVVIVLSIITIFVVYVWHLEAYVFKGSLPGPTTCFIGSVHGNEPVGTHALYDCLQKGWFDKIQKGTVIVIPNPNPIGLLCGIREFWNFGYYDLNREYERDNKFFKSEQIRNVTRHADLVVEFHEGWGYHQIQNGSLGSTISPTPDEFSNTLSISIVNNLNSNITEPHKKFELLKDESCTIESTLACHLEREKRGHILVEITGQNDIQPLNLRMNQAKNIISTVLNTLHIV